MSTLIDPKNHTAVATIVGTVTSSRLHEGTRRGGNEYSLLRVQAQAGQDQISVVISATSKEPSKAQQASEQIRPGGKYLLRGFLMEEEYEGRRQWSVTSFQWLPTDRAPSCVFYLVGELHQMSIGENGVQQCYMVCRRAHPTTGEVREEFLTVYVWPQFDTNEFAGRTALIRGSIYNRTIEDDFGVMIDRKAGLAAEFIQLWDGQQWSRTASRAAASTSALPQPAPAGVGATTASQPSAQPSGSVPF